MVYRFFWFTIGPLIQLYWWVRTRDRDRVPRGRGAIIASNHSAAIDPILICMCFWRQVVWLAKVELVRSRKIAWFFRGAGVIPIDRSAPEKESLDIAERVLAEGKLFGIFPEGTRSPDGRVYRAYTGVARIAERTGAPVIPTAVVGSRNAIRKGSVLARPVPCEVRFGAPMMFERKQDEEPADAYRRFVDELMAEIARLAEVPFVPNRHSRERPGSREL